MGTSKSSEGPSSGSSYDSPWLEEHIGKPNAPIESKEPIDEDIVPYDENIKDGEELPYSFIPPSTQALAPAKRFKLARIELANYARTGLNTHLKRSLSHYVKTGMGGSHRLAKRMTTSIVGASNLFSVLQNISEGKQTEWIDGLLSTNPSSDDVITAIINSLDVNDGTIDDESVYSSAANALSAFLENEPDADLLKLSNQQILKIIEYFLSNEIYTRVILDIGQPLENKAATPKDAQIIRNEMRGYINSVVAAQLYAHWKSDITVTTEKLKQVLNSTLEATLSVFTDTED